MLDTNQLNILIVDDSTSYRRLLARHLQSWDNYHIVEAEDGSQALAILNTQKIDMVISDWEMPGLNGEQLCRKLRDSALPHYIYFILLTSRVSEDDLVLGMEAGADDFLTKPINHAELRVRMRAGERVLRLQETLADKNRHLLDAYARIENDLKAAAQVQQSLLPQHTLKQARCQCQWFFQPSQYVSGDMLSFFMLDEHHIGFYSVDVAGHGVKSAMLSVSLSRILSHGSTNGLLKKRMSTPPYYYLTPPAHVVAELNQQFQMSEPHNIYFTMVYGFVNTTTGEGVLTRAGHPFPVIIRGDGYIDMIETGSLPVGFMPDTQYDNTPFQLSPNSRLYLYTDGIVECENGEQQIYGESNLLNFLSKHHHHDVGQCLVDLQQELYAWGHHPQKGLYDDISMLVISMS